MELTKQQIQHWRELLTLQLGCYALVMPEEDIILLYKKIKKDLENV